jgi:ligand-binding sensor domain-containing protein
VGSIGGQVWTADTTGTRWRNVAGLPNAQVRALTVCNNGALYAAPEQTGVWKSSMAALEPWQNAGSAGLGAARITSLACDPRSGFLYAGANGQGVFLSTDGGAGWTAINQGLPGNIASSVVASPLSAWRVWVALQDGGVYRSDNAGLNWLNAGTGLPVSGGVSHLVAGSDGALYAGTAQGVFHLPAGGTAWLARSAGLPSGKLTALWSDPKRGGVVMVAVTGRGVYLSVNAGTNWTPSVTDPNSADVVAFGGDAQRIHAATLGTGLAWSTNGGAEFGSVQRAEAIPQVVTDLAVDAADGNALYLATGGQGMLTSRDGGGHWQAVNNGLGNLSLLCLVVHPTRSRELYAGTHAGVFMTRDAGATWTEMNQGLINRNVTALTFDTQVPDVLYVGIEGGGIFYHVTRP